MTIDAVFLMVKNRAQTEFGLEAAEYGFEIGQQGIGSPQALGVPRGFVAPQTVDPGMGQAAIVFGIAIAINFGI